MRPKHKIQYTPVAIDDMDEIFSYITQDNIEAAKNMLNKLTLQIEQLGDFPLMGSVLPEDEYPLLARGYRFIVVHPYLVFYRIIENKIVIHRVLHGRRDYLRDLFGGGV